MRQQILPGSYPLHGRTTYFLSRLVVFAFAVGLLANCTSASILDAYTSEAPPVSGHVYLIRGLIGEVFSRGLDDLADKIKQRGLRASVHGLFGSSSLAEEIIQKYKRDPSSAPIILIGHSSGGDAIISMAERMKAANVPVGIAFAFDPTPTAGRVPGNVELFVNLFQKTNPIGGGVIKPGDDFRGQLINVDLREHTEIIHITLDKSSQIHDLVTQEIMDFVSFHALKQEETAVTTVAAQKNNRRAAAALAAPEFVRPFFLSYVVPRNEPIELWDGGVRIAARPDQNLQTIAASYRVPVWLVSVANKADADGGVEPGKPLIIPQHMYRTGRSPIGRAAAE